jgi:hypothetical protein
MPLEIRELNIQVNVGQQQSESGQEQPGSSQQSGGGGTDIIKQCVEDIMDIINKQKER